MNNTVFVLVMVDDPELDGIEIGNFEDALRVSGTFWRRGVENVVVELDPADDFLRDDEVVFEVGSDDAGFYATMVDLPNAVRTAIQGVTHDRFKGPRHRVARRRKYESKEEMLRYRECGVDPDKSAAERAAYRAKKRAVFEGKS